MLKEPKYCPWCGSEIVRFGHDDSCDRPKNVQMIVSESEEAILYKFAE